MHLRELKFPLMGGDSTLGEALSLSLDRQGPSPDPYTTSMGTSPIPANGEEGERDVAKALLLSLALSVGDDSQNACVWMEDNSDTCVTVDRHHCRTAGAALAVPP